MKRQVDFSSLHIQVENARENMTRKAPSKRYRDGISVFDLAGTFPDEATAGAWFENHVRPDGNAYVHRSGLGIAMPILNSREEVNACAPKGRSA